MRGVLSVLGLDQAAQAVLRMRESVEEFMVAEIDEERASAAGTFDKLGNNLGALGFLIDMLNYQPALAKKLFVYDDSTGELRPLMGRSGHAAQEAPPPATSELSQEVNALVSAVEPGASRENLTAQLDAIAAHAVLAEQTGIAHSAREAAAAVSAQDTGAAVVALSNLAAAVKPPVAVVAPAASEPDVEEDDLRDIFLEEAREVVQNGLTAIAALKANPGDASELTTLRRAFHTLKGSSRMVGLTEFGEAAWSLEQVLNTWLADQKTASEDLCTLSGDAMQAFGRWTEDIANQTDGAWKAAMFRGPADAMRTESRLVPPGSARTARHRWKPLPSRWPVRLHSKQLAKPPAFVSAVRFDVTQPADFEFDDFARRSPLRADPCAGSRAAAVEIDGIDFGSLAAVSTSAAAACRAVRARRRRAIGIQPTN